MAFSSLSVRALPVPENLRPLLNGNIPLISGNYGLRNHFWPPESLFLMRKNEKKSRFSQNPWFWAFGFLIYTSSSANFKKIHRDTFFLSHSMLLILVKRKIPMPKNCQCWKLWKIRDIFAKFLKYYMYLSKFSKVRGTINSIYIYT